MNLNSLKKIHFVGIGGIGISALAKMMLKLDKKVTGSDLFKSEITDKLKKLGATIYFEHNEQNLAEETDLLVYSAAVPFDNPERIKAESLKIKQLSYGELLGNLSEDKKTLAVTGTNGKTTTSAILGKVLFDANLDPTVVIGSQLKQFDGNFVLGQSDYLVAEADEYKANMLKIKPWTIFLTSIEEDHLDFYKDLEDIISHFQKFVNNLPSDGLLFYNADDNNIKSLKMPKNSFGCSLFEKNDYWAKDIRVSPGEYQFKVYNQENFLGDFTLKIPGDYNILNSLLIIAFCHLQKIDFDKVKKSLADFNGLWRRFEILGKLKNLDDVLLVSDYTHHPSAIKKTLKAAKEFYPDRRLFLVYQPHQHDRTKKLFKQFLNCFNKADLIILNEIYDVAGRKYQEDETTSSLDLVDEIKNKHESKEIIYSPDFVVTEKLITENLKAGDLLLIMGAGDINNLAKKLIDYD